MSAADLTVSINGDASGLISAASAASSALVNLKNTASAALAGVQDKTVRINAVDNTAAGVASARAAINSLSDKTVTVTVRYQTVGKAFKDGTENAPAGLAVVNDEKGIADPRELIYHDGKYMIYNGRDITVPLSKGDRVYTASQTKKIMAAMGIPHYASGLNNTQFKAASDEFKSRTKSSNVPIDEQIAWWREAMEEYAYDAEVVRDCSEEIFSLTRKLADSLNDVSDVYIEERTYFNDWETYGDTALATFERIRDRNAEYLDDGFITWDEYVENVTSAGNELYEGRIKQSEKWLKHELKYNDMSYADYIAGLNRMADYTAEYYRDGIIDYREYADGIADINDSIADMTAKKNAEEYSHWESDAKNWKTLRTVRDDWENYGDSLVSFYQRCIERVGEFYKAGVIDWQTYSDDTFKYSVELYKAQLSAAEDAYDTAEDLYDASLDDMREYIDEIEQQFSDEEQALRDSWDVSDRAADMADIRADLEIYKSAVTNKGKEHYEDLQDELTELEREEELYELEQEHQETLEILEEQYEEAEKQKEKALSDLKSSSIDISSYCKNIDASATEYSATLVEMLKDVITAIKDVSVNVYNDNSTVNNNSSGSAKVPAGTIARTFYG